MRDQLRRTSVECPTELAVEIVGGKWKLVILEHLVEGVLRFGELQRTLPTITARMLTRQLRELEIDGLVRRHVYTQVPPKVEYSLTTVGRSLEPLLVELRTWGEWYRDQSSRKAPEPPQKRLR
jgi:DNA-binding HxlR family transcriptional regulator